MDNTPGRRVLVALAVLAGVGLLGGYGVAMRARPHPETVSRSSPTPAPKSAGKIFVHVGGSVHQPGLYGLPDGSRVNDAVSAAGGATGEADLDALNLAATVKDGDKVLVPAKGAAGQVPGGGGPAVGGAQGGLVNINVASSSELQSLPGIGPALSERIIAYRQEHGGFRTIEDLMKVSGIGPKKFEGLKDLVTV